MWSSSAHLNQTLFPWDKVGKQLLNHGNMIQEMLKLLSDISHAFTDQWYGLSGDRLLEGIADDLGKFSQAKMASFSYAVTFTLIVCLALLFLMVWGRKASQYQEKSSCIKHCVTKIWLNKKGEMKEICWTEVRPGQCTCQLSLENKRAFTEFWQCPTFILQEVFPWPGLKFFTFIFWKKDSISNIWKAALCPVRKKPTQQIGFLRTLHFVIRAATV